MLKAETFPGITSGYLPPPPASSCALGCRSYRLTTTGLLCIMCYTDVMKQRIEQNLAARGLALPIHARPGWYFQ
ncbi:hypothetical protein B0E42_01425 [Pseudomonas sp. A25(2017)]|nr:hypothetical protein B0E42_01425 [Pseudomonas sp. A25(2017)]